MSIKARSILVTGASLLIVLTMSIAYFAGALQAYQDAEQKRIISQAAGLYNKATIELSLERSLMQATMALPTPIAAGFRESIDAQRELSEGLFSETWNTLDQLQNHGGAEEFRQMAQELLVRINLLRRAADQALSVPRDQRNPDFVATFPIVFPSIIEDLSGLAGLLTDGDAIPPEAAIASRIQNLAWAIREFSGRERTFLAIALANQEPISEADLVRMNANWERAMTAWRQVQTMWNRNLLPDALNQPLGVLQAGHFADYVSTREDIKNASERGLPYPTDFATYFAESSAALQQAVDLSYAGNELNAAFWTRYTRDSLLELGFSAVVMVLALVMSFWFMHYISNRVSIPLRRMAAVMDDLSRGVTDSGVSDLSGHRDEIGDLARGIDKLQTNLKNRDRDGTRESTAHGTETRATYAVHLEVAETLEQELGSALSASRTGVEQVYAHTDSIREVLERAATGSSALVAHIDAERDRMKTVREQSGVLRRGASALSETTRSVREELSAAESSVADAGRTVARMEESGDEVRRIVADIREIAEKTSMLALNAAIQAARAGEAGKGFSVVAGEVKTLSERAREATEQIEANIATMIESSRQTGELVRTIGRHTSALADVTSHGDAHATSQVKAAAEVVDAVDEIATQLDELQQGLRSLEETSHAGRDRASEAERVWKQLKETIQKMERGAERCVQEIRELS